VEPTALKPNESRCDVTYLASGYYFVEVRGNNFPDAKLLADGSGLETELYGCGVLQDWNFTWTPNDVKYQWYASGKLPGPIKKGCPGRAVVSAGAAKCDC
jgi:hypothetical protein